MGSCQRKRISNSSAIWGSPSLREGRNLWRSFIRRNWREVDRASLDINWILTGQVRPIDFTCLCFLDWSYAEPSRLESALSRSSPRAVKWRQWGRSLRKSKVVSSDFIRSSDLYTAVDLIHKQNQCCEHFSSWRSTHRWKCHSTTKRLPYTDWNFQSCIKHKLDDKIAGQHNKSRFGKALWKSIKARWR